VLYLAELKDQGLRARGAASMAKMYATDVAMDAAIAAFQIHGAAGVSAEYGVSRHYRDAKVFQIVEGANDIHRILIAKHALKAAS
jgi:alkylation response protein AidB-like acyl-CoA dehydrogenase